LIDRHQRDDKAAAREFKLLSTAELFPVKRFYGGGYGASPPITLPRKIRNNSH
jgi:hypothetical protein